MKHVPLSVKKELEKLKLMDEAPYVFLNHKIEFCVKLYSPNYKELSKWDIYDVMHRYPELIDYRHLSDVQHDFIQEQYTFAIESI